VTRWGILVAEPTGFSVRAAELLGAVGTVWLADLDRLDLLRRVRDANVLWVRLRHRIDREVMDAAPALRVIATPTTGLNHIDLCEAARRGVEVVSLRGESDFLKDVHATAEHTLALMLALLRHLPAAVAHVQQGCWNRDLFRGSELYGRTVGVVGYGRLGSMVARYLVALGARVLASDPNVDAADAEAGVSLVPLSQLLAEADLISLHVSLSDATRRFFGREQFLQMRAGSRFVNTARGELVDETALLEALETGHLGGAALDVLADEDSGGMANNPLVAYAQRHPNLIITPHIGGCTFESMEKTEVFLARKLCAVLSSLRDTQPLAGT